MANFQEIARRKVLGVPLLYWAGGAVVILAVVAYKLKSTTTETTDVTGNESTTGKAPTANPYDSLDPDGTGTVTVVTPTTPDTTVTTKTNETWVRDGASWLVSEKKADGATAYEALSKYVEGAQRSYDENVLVNLVIEKYGLPPEAISTGGTVSDAPAKKQFPNPPGTHTIVGSNDNTFPKLAALYYGNGSGDNQDLLQFANPPLGNSIGPFPVGTKIAVPVYHDPVYWTVPKTMTWAQAAGQNGISELQLKNLNNGTSAWRNAPTLAKGQRIRVK